METKYYINYRHELKGSNAEHTFTGFYTDREIEAQGIVGHHCRLDINRYASLSELQSWIRKIENLQEQIRELGDIIPFKADSNYLSHAIHDLHCAKSEILQNADCTTTDALLAQVAPDWDD